MGWSDWARLGGSLASGPGVASWDGNRVDVFYLGGHRQLLRKWWAGSSWSGEEDLGGTLRGAPAAVSWGRNRIDVFAVGDDIAMWHLAWDGSSWTGWESLGGELGSDPTVASWGDNRLDCFAQGSNHSLWHKAWDGRRWHEWEDLGGLLAGGYAPGAISRQHEIIDIFVNAANPPNHIAQLSWVGGSGWTQWSGHGGPIRSAPGVASWGPDRVDLFAGEDDEMRQLTWNQESGWTGFHLGGEFKGAPAAISRRRGLIDVFVRGTDNALWQRWYDPGPGVPID